VTGVEVLSRRALSRATLERQLLLRRSDLPALEALEHLVGLNAQNPNPPYVSLWARLEGFEHDELTRLLYNRSVVRSSVLRGTQHLVAASDFVWLRPLVQPALDRGRRGAFGRRTAGMDLARLAAAARALLAGRSLTRSELGKRLAERWADRDAEALAWSAQALVPLVHPPPNGTWNRSGATPFTLAEEWIGRPMEVEPPVARMILRYLAAFGPAGVMDIQTWSGVTRLAEAVDALRPQLRAFHDETGRELFDLPDAPMPDPDVAAPARFLPDFDNLILAHADRTRLMIDEYRKRVSMGAVVLATFLVDGFVKGTWAVSSEARAATLVVEPFEPLSKADVAALTDEGERLLAFVAADAEAYDIEFREAA
jgi:hypothetical protein